MLKHNHQRVTAWWLPSILVVAVSACSSGCDPDDNASLQVPLNGQETSLWCWAASGQMTMDYLHPGSNVQQCDEANREFGRDDCCNSPVPNACVNGGWPEYDKYGFTASRTSDQALTWKQIKKQIYCAKKPFAFTWHWDNGGGHMMVATGYQTTSDDIFVNVNDPDGVYQIVTYDTYVGGSGYDHTHWDDFYNIRYTGGQ